MDVRLAQLDEPEAEIVGDYDSECRGFLERALKGERLCVFVAEQDGSVVSHVFVELVTRCRGRPARRRNGDM